MPEKGKRGQSTTKSQRGSVKRTPEGPWTPEGQYILDEERLGPVVATQRFNQWVNHKRSIGSDWFTHAQDGAAAVAIAQTVASVVLAPPSSKESSSSSKPSSDPVAASGAAIALVPHPPSYPPPRADPVAASSAATAVVPHPLSYPPPHAAWSLNPRETHALLFESRPWVSTERGTAIGAKAPRTK